MTMMDPLAALRALTPYRGDAVVIPTMTAARMWAVVTERPELDLPLSGAMGKASSVGLGIALAQPQRRVIVLDGDGSLLMNLGSLVTIAHMRPPNLLHIVLENGVYLTSGGQPIPGRNLVDFAGLARAAGYAAAYTFEELAIWEAEAGRIVAEPGPVLVCLRVMIPSHLPQVRTRRTLEALPEVRATLAGT
jgi:phosphonopyruvate decarboxylase